MTWSESVCELHGKVRQAHPLIHHITNLVVTNITANITLAAGASPVMLGAIEDARDMTKRAQALVLNCGTMSVDSAKAMVVAGKAANESNIPVILDPVAAGATPFRSEKILGILDCVRCTIIRGNSSEMDFLAGGTERPRGVDAKPQIGDNQADLDRRRSELAVLLAQKYGAVAVVTGQRDYVSDGTRIAYIDNGHPLLPKLTGTGCMATAVIACWAAAASDPFLAAVGGLASYGLAAEIAGQKSQGPGTFQAHLFDAMYNLTAEQLKAGLKITIQTEV